MLLSKPQLGLIKKWSKNKLKWNGRQNQTYWMKIRVQTSSVKIQNVWLFHFFSGIQMNRFFVGKKSCPCFLHRVPETLIQLHTLNSSFPKIQLTFQSRLFEFKSWLKSLKPKTEQGRTFRKAAFVGCSNFYQTQYQTLLTTGADPLRHNTTIKTTITPPPAQKQLSLKNAFFTNLGLCLLNAFKID